MILIFELLNFSELDLELDLELDKIFMTLNPIQ
jgi:hypothetical protein